MNGILLGFALAVACIPTADLRGQDLPAKLLRPLEAQVLALQALGLDESVQELREVLVLIAYPQKSLDLLDRRLKSVRPVTRGKKSRTQRVIKSLGATIRRLEAALKDVADPDARQRAAEAILRLDHRSEQANLALGNVKDGSRWLTLEASRRSVRQKEIQAALQQVRKLQPKVVVSPSEHELLLHVHGSAGHRLTSCGITIHTAWPLQKTTRLLQNVIRAVALSHYLIDGKPVTMPQGLSHESVLFTGKPHYEKALAFDIGKKRVTPKRAKSAPTLASYYRKDDSLVNNRTMENHALAGIFSHVTGIVGNALHGKKHHATLIAGHANWVLMALTGASLPGIAYRIKAGQEGTASTRDPVDELLFGAGLMGARSWLRDRVLAGEDPPWSRSFYQQIGRIDDINLLKTTFIADYLQQNGPLAPLLTKSIGGVGKGKAEMRQSIEAGIGMELAPFEAAWRAWIRSTGRQPDSLLARLNGNGGAQTLSNDEAAVLVRLANIRKAALTDGALGAIPAITLDAELSANALLHAQYLGRHPEQAARWPDAHEETTDSEGFTPEGCWAGNHSVIAPGTRKAANAIDNWMATFFHRLPLLEPGLLRIGWGLSDGMAVMDSGSIVRPMSFEWQVAWPPAGMRDVPRHFQPEMPNPFPGEDQSTWGYPITLQLGPRKDGAAPRLEFTLRKDEASGDLVACFATDPHEPGNPLLVPKLAWCLIPKQPLAANTTYFAQATDTVSGTVLQEWSFQTGR